MLQKILNVIISEIEDIVTLLRDFQREIRQREILAL